MLARLSVRQRWRSLVAVAALVAFAGGVTMAAFAGARRTATSFDRFLTASRAQDVLVLSHDVRGGDVARIRALPGVAHVGRGRFLALVDADGQLFDVGFAVVGPEDDELFRGVFRLRVVDGRLPRRGAAEEVAIGEAFARDNHLAVGDSFVVRGFTPGQVQVITNGGDVDGPDGPSVDLRVVGITRSPSDLTLQGQVGGELILPRAFVQKYGSRIGNYYGPHGATLLVRLRDGAAGVPRFLQRLHHVLRQFDVDPRALSAGGVQESIDILAVAVLVFGIVAAVAGLVAVALITTREVRLFATDLTAVRALGMRRRARAAATALPVVLAIAAGGVAAFVVAVVASPWFPFGVAGDAEPSPGVDVDWLVLGVGGLVLALVLVSIVAVASWRSADRDGDATTPRLRPAATTRLLEAVGAAVPLTVGARLALEPGRGRTAVPVRSTLVAAVLSLLGIVAVTVFSASLTHVVDTPAAQGRPWDATVTDQQVQHTDSQNPCSPAATRLLHDPAIGAIAGACSAGITLNGRAIGAVAVIPIRGDIQPTLLDGRRPRTTRELALGTETMRALAISLGSNVAVQTPAGLVRYRVVGRVTLARVGDPQAIADGAVLTGAGMRRTRTSADELTFAFVVRFRPGVNPVTAAERIDRLPGIDGFGNQTGVQLSVEPLEIRRLDQVAWMPLALAGFLALLGLIAIVHLLITSTGRRKRDFAVLKVLGCDQRQIKAMVAWQATIVVGIGFVVAAVLGIATGAGLWHAAARSVGVDVAAQIPLIAVVGIAIASVAIANLVAYLSARTPATTPAAITLRTE